MSNSYSRALRRVYSPRVLVFAAVATTSFARPAFAAPRLDVSGTACPEADLEMERRLTPVFHRSAAAGLAASVSFEADPAGTRVTVTTREQSTIGGETVLVVASCDEALDAAVLVLSLAFGPLQSGESVDATLPPRADTRSVKEPAPTEADLRLEDAVRRLDEYGDGHRAVPAILRLSLAGGVDVGTLPNATAFVAGSVTRSWSALEVRGSLYYGLPTEHEREETGARESVQRDFGALGLGVCYGMGAFFRIAGCLGSQFGVVRVSRRLDLEGGTAIDEDETAPRVTGTLGVILATRRGPIRPEVELSGAALAAGRRDGAPWVAFRGAAGAAVDF